MKPRYHRKSMTSNEGWLVSYADLITNLLIFFVLIISASSIQTGKMEKIVAAISQNQSVESLASAADKVSKALKEEGLTENVSVNLTDDGLEISFDSGVTFASGSADVLASMEEPLGKVLVVLQPYVDKYKVAVEGHTDERPIRNSVYKSNWELSSARAIRIRERLESVGVDPRRVRVEAYADNKPLATEPTNALDREILFAKQRRVVIRLF